MKTLEIKLSGSGTANAIAIALISLGRELQIADVYGTEVPKKYDDGVICSEITED